MRFLMSLASPAGARHGRRVARLQRGGKQEVSAAPRHFGAGACRGQPTGDRNRRDTADRPAALPQRMISGDLGGVNTIASLVHGQGASGACFGLERAPPSGFRGARCGASELPRLR